MFNCHDNVVYCFRFCGSSCSRLSEYRAVLLPLWLLNISQIRSTCGSRETCCPRQGARLYRDIWNKNNSFNIFPDKDKTEGRKISQNLWTVYLRRHKLIIHRIQRQPMYVYRNIKLRSCKHCCCGKAISIAYSECGSVALFIQHAMHMHPIILSSVACPVLQNFSTLSHKRHIFGKRYGM